MRPITRVLLVLLLFAAGFAAWAWLRPYEWNADPAAGFRISQARVIRDRSYCWVDLALDPVDGRTHGAAKDIKLLTGGGGAVESAETTTSPSPDGKGENLWLRFYVEEDVLRGPLELRINEGRLLVKSTSGVPALENGAQKLFLTHRW